MTKVRHIAFVTQNIEEMRDYYLDKIGGEVVDDHVENVRIIKLRSGFDMIELLQYDTMAKNNLRRVGISHVAFTHDPDGNMSEEVCHSCKRTGKTSS